MIIWQKNAIDDLESIHRYISTDNPIAATSVVETIIRISTSQLSAFPNSGRKGRVAKSYELVVSKTPYIVVYSVQNEKIDIFAVRHTSQQWPKNF